MQFIFPEKEEVGAELTPKQEMFCQYYCKNLATFCNATLSYAEAYGVDLDSLPDNDAEYEQIPDGFEKVIEHGTDENTGEPKEIEKKVPRFRNGSCIKESTYRRAYNNCSSAGSRLLRNVKIQERTTKLFNEMLNNEVVDAELTRIMLHGLKDSDRINAIKEFNALRARIIKKVDLTSNGNTITGGLEGKSDDELAAIIAAREQAKRDAEAQTKSGGTSSDGSGSGTSQEGTGTPAPAEVHSVSVPGV